MAEKTIKKDKKKVAARSSNSATLETGGMKAMKWPGEFAAVTGAMLPLLIDGEKHFFRRQFGLGDTPELDKFELADLMPATATREEGAGRQKFLEIATARLQSIGSWTPKINIQTKSGWTSVWYGQEGFEEALEAYSSGEPGYFGFALPTREQDQSYGENFSITLEKSQQVAEEITPRSWDIVDWD